jgi:polysaccharide deacetylase family protein (PEP-CTERM system associated)
MTAPAAARIVNGMSIDVEDYFQVSAFEGVAPRHRWGSFESRVTANTERLLAIFAEADVHATFFVLGWVAEQYPSLVARIAAAGHEVACHSHAHRLVYDLTRTAFRNDLRRAKDAIESAAGAPVHGYRAPSYSITPRSLWALDILIEEGFRYDASIFPIHHDRYGIPLSPRHPYLLHREGGQLIEVPASTVRLGPLNLPIAGGGYFRLLPYAWTRWGIRSVNERERRPVIFYLHPWEIDPDQPRLRAGLTTRIRHYGNLGKTERRIRRLLGEFRFAPVSRVIDDVRVEAVTGRRLAMALPYLW